MATSSSRTRERGWNSKIGVILAVAGSAIGFGNFLRFPGLAAQYGGGAFMIAYFISLFLMGIPLAWIEWTIGRRGGMLGAHSTASIFMLLMRSRLWKYLGLIGVMIPLGVSMYYLFIEGWTLGYAWKIADGSLCVASPEESAEAFNAFVGTAENGVALTPEKSSLIWFFGIAVLFNLWILYRGVGRGIEWFCKWSLPVLLITSLLILVRTLTLGAPDPTHPERNIDRGLGYMWNPDKVVLEAQDESGKWKTVDMLSAETHIDAPSTAPITTVASAHPSEHRRIRHISLLGGLSDPEVWLAAAGQIFWSLSICFGTVTTYASYLKRRDDLVLSSLSAASANECVEVGIAGMMIVPAAVAVLGISAVAGASTFGLGFNVLPQVFTLMPAGQVFGALFFGLLFIAAVTSSISIIQPAVAFLEEFWLLSRKQSIVIIGMILTVGAMTVAWFSRDLMGLDTLDFWLGTVGLYINGLFFLIIFCYKWNGKEAYEELHVGAKLRIPRFLFSFMRWAAPCILLAIICSWIWNNLAGTRSPQVQSLLNGELGAWLPLLWWSFAVIFMVMVARTSRRFHRRLDAMKARDGK